MFNGLKRAFCLSFVVDISASTSTSPAPLAVRVLAGHWQTVRIHLGNGCDEGWWRGGGFFMDRRGMRRRGSCGIMD